MRLVASGLKQVFICILCYISPREGRLFDIGTWEKCLRLFKVSIEHIAKKLLMLPPLMEITSYILSDIW